MLVLLPREVSLTCSKCVKDSLSLSLLRSPHVRHSDEARRAVNDSVIVKSMPLSQHLLLKQCWKPTTTIIPVRRALPQPELLAALSYSG